MRNRKAFNSKSELKTAIDNPPYRAKRMLMFWSAWVLGFAAPARRLYGGIAQAWSAWFAAGGVR